MNIVLWILQVVLALHTLMGAVWKFSHSAEETMLSLGVIPPGIWLAMAMFEIVCSIDLLLPALVKKLGLLVPVAAALIALEMFVFCGIHIASGDPNRGPLAYWLIVAFVCGFIVYGRTVKAPIK